MELPETANKVQLLVTRTEASQNRETLYVIIYRGGGCESIFGGCEIKSLEE